MNKPIYGITLFFILGIIIGRYLTLPFLPLYLGLIALFVLAFVLYLKKKERWASYSLFLITLLIGIVYFYYIYYPHSPQHIVTYAPSQEKVTLVGEVVSRPQLRERRIRFILQTEKIIAQEERIVEGRVWVVSYFPLENYHYGDIVRLEGRLRLPEEAKEKGVFDWQKYLSYQRIWVELATGKVTVVKRGRGSFLIRWAYKSCAWMVRVIEHTLPQKHSAVLKGIMLGDKESLPFAVQESFLRTGTGQAVPVQLG